jgi:hypothetical protein
MILSDLLHNEVRGPDDEALGRVIDARFVVDGAPSPLLADARLAGLVVSPHSGSSFLGYERLDTRSPWPIAEFLRWRHRGTFLVDWADIARFDDGVVHVREGYHRRSPALDRR